MTGVPAPTGVAITAYPDTATPPSLVGGAKATVTAAALADTDRIDGGLGAVPVTRKVSSTRPAAFQLPSPACEAVTPQIPTATTVTAPVALTVHAEFVVCEALSAYVTGRPEVADAASCTTGEPKATFA